MAMGHLHAEHEANIIHNARNTLESLLLDTAMGVGNSQSAVTAVKAVQEVAEEVARWLRDLEAQANTLSAGTPQPTSPPSEAATLADQAAARLLQFLAYPPRDVFEDIGGVPQAAEAANQRAAEKFQAAAASALNALAALVSRFPPAWPQQAQEAAKQASPRRDGRAEALVGGVLIEELDPEEEATMPNVGGANNTVDYLLACATFGFHKRLSMPWTSTSLCASASHVLDIIEDQAGMPAEGKRRQALFLAVLPEAVRQLRAQATQEKSPETSRLNTEAGPDAFGRAVAASKLAWLVHQLDCRALSQALPVLLPTVLAVVDDSAPAVQSYGLWSLCHIASEAAPSDLRWQKPLMLDVAKSCISGCDDMAWPAAASAATGLVICLEGRDPFATGYAAIMEVMLIEGERFGHKRARRLVWLDAMQPLLSAMGLASVKYFTRLLPLLLQWTDASDRPTSLGALDALHSLLSRTWPRMIAHHTILLPFLENGLAAAQKSVQGTAEERGMEVEAWKQDLDLLSIYARTSASEPTNIISRKQECQ